MPDGYTEVHTEIPTIQQERNVSRSSKTTRRLLTWLVINAVVILAVVFAARWWQSAQNYQQAEEAAIVANVHGVSPRIPGIVTQVLVGDNQTVKTGQVLFQLDPRDLQMRLQQTRAAVVVSQQQAAIAAAQTRLTQAQALAARAGSASAIQNARAAISRAQTSLKDSQTAVSATAAALGQSQAELQRATAEYRRYEDLQQHGTISPQQMEQARRDYEMARAHVALAQQQAAEAQSRVRQSQSAIEVARAAYAQSLGTRQQVTVVATQTAVTSAQLKAARSQVEQALASLAQAQLHVSYTTVTAPISGRVIRTQVQVGQTVQPGVPLMAIVSPGIWVVANFRESQLEKMRPGQPVDIRVTAYPQHVFRGFVDSFSPPVAAQTAVPQPGNAHAPAANVERRIPVKLVFDPASIKGFESMLMPGMSVVPTVYAKTASPSTVPMGDAIKENAVTR